MRTKRTRNSESKVKDQKIPPIPKLFFTLFMAILIPVNWLNYGLENFLWLSDITLFLTYFGFMFEKAIFTSMAAISGLVFELIWTVVFVLALVFGIHISDLADYMFDQSIPIWVRAVSLFHIVLPPLLIWLVMHFGYIRKALYFQLLLIPLIVFASWLWTSPSANINWVFTYRSIEGLQNHPILFLIIECIVIGIVFTLTHFVIVKFARSKK